MAGSYTSYRTGAVHYFPIPGREQDFSRLSDQIRSDVEKISQNVASMKRMVGQLGTPQDNDDLRSKLQNIQHYTNKLAKDTNALLKDLQSLPASSLSPADQRQWKMQKERLTNDFTRVLTNFQAIQREAAQKEKESIQRARAHSNLSFGEDDRKAQQLIQLESPVQNQMLQLEEDVDLELLRERETAMHQLETDIVSVNEIFRDLATMVHEQGEVVDSIEANMESTQIHVSDATDQLHKASTYQSAVRKKKVIIFVIVLVVLAIVGIIIWQATK